MTIAMPDDFHVHLRDGVMLEGIVSHTAASFARAIVMPNLKPPIATTEEARLYRNRILALAPGFTPLMTLYLTDRTEPDEVNRAVESEMIYGIKLYPSGATTNSEAGVHDLEKLYPVLARMEQMDLPLLVHGEVTDASVDVFDREKVFLDRHLKKLPQTFPGLRIVFEHITTREAASYVMQSPKNVAATITPHHLLMNRNSMFRGGIRPHNYCLPVLKREEDRVALLDAATSGNGKFFAGTDSAPHERSTKENSCGCAGIYNAHAAVELYAEAFEAVGKLDRLEAFLSHYGADFYRVPRNQKTIRLTKKTQTVPDYFDFGGQKVVPMRAGETISWSIERDS